MLKNVKNKNRLTNIHSSFACNHTGDTCTRLESIFGNFAAIAAKKPKKTATAAIFVRTVLLHFPVSLLASDFKNLAAAVAVNSWAFSRISTALLDSHQHFTVPSLPQASSRFGQYLSMASTNFSDHLAALNAAAASSTPNDLNAYAAAAAAANQSNGMSDCMLGGTIPSKRSDNNNVFWLNNIADMDVMKLFQNNALMQQPGFGDMEDKVSKEQSNQLINGMKRQMAMPNSINTSLQSYDEQLATCMPPSAKRATLPNANPFPMPAISQAQTGGLAQMSLPITNGQSLMAGGSTAASQHALMQQHSLLNMTSTPSSFMMNNGSIAQSMAQHSMMPQQMPLSSYPNMGALNALSGTANGNSSAGAMSSLQYQQQQQQNFQLAAAMKHQNQLKAQQQHAQMLQNQVNQAKMHPQAMAQAAAQQAARAQAIREAQIVQHQQQQRQQKLAAALPSSPQQGMNGQDYLTQRQLAEYTNLLRLQQHQQQHQQQQQASLQQQQMAQAQQQQALIQQHQQAALIAAAQQEQLRRKQSQASTLVPMTTLATHSLAASSSSSVSQSLGSQLANVMAAAARESARSEVQKTSTAGLNNGQQANKFSQPSYTSNASIVPMPTNAANALATSTASEVSSPLKGDSAVNGSVAQISMNIPFNPAVALLHSGPDDERFQAFLASIRLQYEQQLQQKSEVKKSIINGNATALQENQTPKVVDSKEIDKPQAVAVNKVPIKQEAASPSICVDPVSM